MLCRCSPTLSSGAAELDGACTSGTTIFSKEHEMFALCPEEFSTVTGTFYADGGGGSGGMCVDNYQHER